MTDLYTHQELEERFQWLRSGDSHTISKALVDFDECVALNQLTHRKEWRRAISALLLRSQVDDVQKMYFLDRLIQNYPPDDIIDTVVAYLKTSNKERLSGITQVFSDTVVFQRPEVQVLLPFTTQSEIEPFDEDDRHMRGKK